MTYDDALCYIHSIPKFRRPLGNEKLSELLAALGNPQKKLDFVHIAGTNGKGSTAAMTAQILQRSGYDVGLYTSPFIEVFNERIRVNGENISDDLLIEYTERVKNIMESSGAFVSEFAFVTAMAFLYFYEQKCDIVVLEAGMGGRLDATNVIDESVVSVICAVGLDHTQYLGDTVLKIAAEKCGIIKRGGYVAAYPNEESVMEIIRGHARDLGASLHVADAKEAMGYELSLAGEYQRLNAAVVLEIIKGLREKGFSVPHAAVTEGLKNTEWPARFEWVADDVVIDGAHNIDGARALRASLAALNKDVTLVMAMMEDKDCGDCVRELLPAAKRFIATEIDMPRCLSAEKLAETAGGAEVKKTPREAIFAARKARGGIVCVCGSLYLAGEARKIFRNL